MPKVLVKNQLWKGLGYEPHPAQQEVHDSRARHRVNAAGRREGKSQVGGHELMPEVYKALFRKEALAEQGIRQEYWIVGPNYSDSEKEFRVFYNDCKRLKLPFDHPGTYYNARSGDMTVTMWDGLFVVTAKSAAKPETLVGEGLHGVVMAEAAKMKESTWVKYIRPTLADFNGWSLWNSTPEGRNWFHDLWKLGQDPHRRDWESWRHPSWVNPHVYPLGATDEGIEFLQYLEERRQPITPEAIIESGVDPEIAALLLDLTEATFNQEIACKFTEYAGRVYKDWDEELHVRDLEVDPNWPVYVAVDYGWTNPNVALVIQVDPFENVNILGEYYQEERTEQEFANDCLIDPYLGPLIRRATRLYPDPEDPGASNVLADTWRVRIMGGTGGLIKDRVNQIRKLLKVPEGLRHLAWDHPERLPRLRVQRGRCPNFEREMDLYRYPDIKSEIREQPENPLKKDDHCPEALSRFAGGYFGKPFKGGKPRTRKAKVRR